MRSELPAELAVESWTCGMGRGIGIQSRMLSGQRGHASARGTHDVCVLVNLEQVVCVLH